MANAQPNLSNCSIKFYVANFFFLAEIQSRKRKLRRQNEKSGTHLNNGAHVGAQSTKHQTTDG